MAAVPEPASDPEEDEVMKRRLYAGVCAALLLAALALIGAGPRWMFCGHDDPPAPVPPGSGGAYVI